MAAPTVDLGQEQPVPTRLYTFNSNLLTATAFQGIGYGSPDVADALCDLRPYGLRFPGGTIANNYLWGEDSFSEPSNDKTGWAGEQLHLFRTVGRPYDLPGFARVCASSGMEPIWVLNVYEETPESVGVLLDRLRELGLDLRFIEFGNEPYWDGRSLNNVHKYIAFCRPLAAALRAHKPDLKIGACFAPLGRKVNYEERWNAPLAREGWYDAIVCHEYYGGQGFALEEGTELPLEALLNPDALFTEPVQALTALLPGKPIWMTEWNMGSKGIEQWKDRGGELLFLASAHVALLEHREAIELACFHQIYGGRFGTCSWNKEAGRIDTSASYSFFRLLGSALHGAATLQVARFGTDDLRGFATTGPEGKRLFVLNRSAEAHTLQLPFAPTEMLRWTLNCLPEQTLTSLDQFETKTPLQSETVDLPPWSISLIASPTTMLTESRAGSVSGLFPVRPFFTFWHPPYARKQPRVSADGVYTLDFATLTDKSLAVAKMNVEALRLKSGTRYELSFEGRSEPAGGIVVKLPDAAQAADAPGSFVQLGAEFRPMRLEFTYSPDTNENTVTLFFPKERIARGGQAVFRAFALRAL